MSGDARAALASCCANAARWLWGSLLAHIQSCSNASEGWADKQHTMRRAKRAWEKETSFVFWMCWVLYPLGIKLKEFG
jgi:hypothetical protein